MAKIDYLVDIDLNKNQLVNARIQNLSTAPSSPVEGQIYYDTDTDDLRFWNGSDWIAGSEGDIAGVTAGTGLTGGGTTGTVTVNVIGGTGITANANDIAIDSTVVTKTGTQTLTNKTLTAPTITGAGAIAGAFTGDLTGDVTGNADTVTTNANLSGHITSSGNTASLGSFTVAQLSSAISNASISGNNTGDQTTVSGSSGTVTSIGNLTGDITSSNRATTIGANKVITSKILDANVTLAKMANLAADTIIGRANGAGTGVPTALTATQLRTIINVEDGATADQTSVTGSSGTVTSIGNLTGDVTSSNRATTIGANKVITSKILDANVTMAKLANIATDTFIGRTAASTGVPKALSKAEALAILNVADGATVDQTNVSGSAGTVTSIGNLTGDITSSNRATTIASAAVHHAMLHDDIISGQGALTGAIADTDEFLVSDAGTVKKADFSVVRDAVFTDVSGDGTIAAGGDLTITQSSGDFTVTGDLIVSGDTVTVNTATLSVEDPLIALATGNGADSVDIGFFGKYTDGGVAKYSGLFRDASGGGWKLFESTGNSNESPGTGTTINTTTGFSYGNLKLGTIIGALTGDVTGNASTATILATTRSIGGVNFNGSANINLPGVNSAGNQNTSGSAATLTTARTIGGVSFNGSANINLPGVNSAGNQSTSGLAATATLAADATTLATARTIGGVSFDGSANINLPGVNTAGNQATSGLAATATVLATPRAINGVNFNGSAPITVTAAAGTLSGDTLNSGVTASSLDRVGALSTGTIAAGFGNIDNGSSTLDTGAATVASLVVTAAGTFGGGYGSTGATISTAGVGQFNGALTTDGALTALSLDIGTGGVDINGTLEANTYTLGGTNIMTGSVLTTAGTISAGTWQGTAINQTYLVDQSGTNTGDEPDADTTTKGIVERATTDEALAGSDTTRYVTPAGLAARSYRVAIGGATSVTVNHALNTRDVIVQMYDVSSYETVLAQVVRTDADNVEVTFNTAPSAGDIIVLVNKID
jgi:microcompartment protein CcmK/EutM